MLNAILFLTIITVAFIARVYMLRKGTTTAVVTPTTSPSTGSETYASKTKGWILAKVKDNWKTVARVTAILVGCHFLVWYFWPELWWRLAKTPVFWLDHAVLILAFLFLREGIGSKKKFVVGTGWLIAILVLGNVWILWGLGQSYYTTARAKAIAERQQAIAAEEAAQAALPKKFEVIAPVGNWSEKIPTLHGEMLVYHGPVFIQTDNLQVVERDNIATNNRIALTRTNWIRVKSRTMEAVKVTVYR